MTAQTIAPDTCMVRDTAARGGRTCSVAPGTTAMRYLHYGRIILEAGGAPLAFDTGGKETGLIGLNGFAAVTVNGAAYTLGKYDALYTPRDAAIVVTPGADGCDLAEIAAPVANAHPVQFVPYAEVRSNPGLHFETGAPGARRDLNVLLGKNVEAGRIMAGITFSAPGNWTSWPPHEHAAMLEEAYLYVDMPAPTFGVQLVYTNAAEPELATVVHEGDIVLMPAGTTRTWRRRAPRSTSSG